MYQHKLLHFIQDMLLIQAMHIPGSGVLFCIADMDDDTNSSSDQ